MPEEFYKRPMVARIAEIFDHPRPPSNVSQQQFDGAQEALERTAKKEWHELDRSDYWHTLLDFCYVDLQQDLFDHLFPGFLILWWQGLETRMGGPESECDFYRAIDHGRLLTKMMGEERREQVLSWMVDAYVGAVDSWGGKLSVDYDSQGPDNLHGPLWAFNSIAQSIPITGRILDRLAAISTEGRAQWWLVLATGIIWNENQSPFVPPWTSLRGGGGIYITESAASIFDHGYLDENLAAMRSSVSVESVDEMLQAAYKLLEPTDLGLWAYDAMLTWRSDPQRIATRIDRLMDLLSRPDLGGVLLLPLEAED